MSNYSKGTKKRKRATRGTGRLFKKAGTKQLPADSPAKGNFYLTYSVNGKRVTTALRKDGKPITDRKQAEQERKRILAPIQAGDQVEALKVIQTRLTDAEQLQAQAYDEANPPLEIKDAWSAYIQSTERPDSGQGTLKHYEGQWKRFEAWINTSHPTLVYLRDITPLLASDYASSLLSNGLSANSFNKHINFLKLAFRVLSEDARTRVNPFEKIKRKILRTHSRRELTIDELTTLLDSASGDLALLLLLGAATGLRLGDCCTLKWSETDLMRGIIRRIPSKTAKSGKPVVVGIPARLHERLSDTPTKKRTGYVLPRIAKEYAHNAPSITNAVRNQLWNCGIDVHAPNTGTQIERNKDGLPIRDKSGKVITKRTGKPAVVDVGFHSLRHTWVSMHAAVGTPGSIIQNSVGHSNPAMTSHYTHVNEITARDVARTLPAFSGDETPTREPLPLWAQELVEKLNTKNLKKIKAELLKG